MNAPDAELVKGIGRAAGGALIFAIPIFITSEMWSLGHAADPFRLAILLLLTPGLLMGLAHYVGFRESERPIDHFADSLVAIGVAAIIAALFLWVTGIIAPDMGAGTLVGCIGIQIVPGAIGAMLSRSQFGEQREGADRVRESNPSYGGELFLMFAGALFLSFSVAPTEEVPMIAYAMTPWQAIAVMVGSIAIMHVFVYVVEFRSPVPIAPGATPAGLFLRFTLVGYVIVLATSLFLLWVFGRTDGLDPGEMLNIAIVLSCPGAIGAAAARLVL